MDKSVSSVNLQLKGLLSSQLFNLQPWILISVVLFSLRVLCDLSRITNFLFIIDQNQPTSDNNQASYHITENNKTKQVNIIIGCYSYIYIYTYIEPDATASHEPDQAIINFNVDRRNGTLPRNETVKSFGRLL